MQQSVVFNPLYCAATQRSLVLKEKRGWSGDDFTVKDLEGRVWFKMDSKTFSMSDKRKLLDANGQVVCTLTKKMFSLHGKWNLFRGNSTDNAEKVVSIEPKLMTFTPVMRIYLLDGDREPDFVVKGNFREKEFNIFQLVGGQESLIGKCHKQSKYESMSAFLKAEFSDRDTYYLDVLPGVDAAFIVALSVCADEVYHDED